jgi:hypothetical protein
MRLFKDSQGQDWTLSVSVGAIKRVRALTELAGDKIDLLRPEDGDPSLVERLIDPLFVCDLVYCLVKPQADGLGIDDQAFGERMVGPAIGAAMTALYDELIDFFLSIGRTHLAELLKTHKAIVQAIVDEATSQVQQENPSLKTSTPTSSSTSSPASSASTPTPSLSGSSTACAAPGDSTIGTASACSPASSTTAPPDGGG